MRRKSKKDLVYKGVAYRSGFERRLAEEVDTQGGTFDYEAKSYEYDLPITRRWCHDCGSKNIFTTRWYTPDYFFKNGVIVEAKGRLDAEQRKKLLAVREAHPDIDLRLVFMRNNKIHPRSKTRYSDWAENNGFKWAIDSIPIEWIEE